MDVRVRERLIGALVLVTIVVLLVPAILRGRAPDSAESPEEPARRFVVNVAPEEPAPEDEALMPEPELPKAAPEPAVAADAEATPPRRETAAPAETPAWAVQLGAFSGRDKADRLVAELRDRGYAAFVLEYRAAGKVLYRVRVGPEQERARADDIAARLRKDGFQTVVARHP